MSTPAPPSAQERALARRHFVLRFAFGVGGAFVLSEALGWRPTAMPPLLAGALLANLPMRPPLKLCLVVMAAMFVSSGSVWLVSVLLLDTPAALWLAVGLGFFASFLALLRGVSPLPCMLMLISLGVVPVVAVAAPQYAGALPTMLCKSMFIALLVTLAMHALWPRTLPPEPAAAPAPSDAVADPVAIALAATCVVMPLMLVFLLFSPVTALPVMMGAVFVAASFDPGKGRREAWVRVVANAGGGALGALAHWILVAAPSLYTLALLSLLLAFGFAVLMAGRAWPMSTLALANNGCFVILSSSIAQGASSGGAAIERVVYFSLAGLFTTVAMYLAWAWFDRRPPAPQPA